MERSRYLKSAAGCSGSTQQSLKRRLNMELDPQSLFVLHVYSCTGTHWLRPRNSPPTPAFGLREEDAISQPR